MSRRNFANLLNNTDNSPQRSPLELPEIADYWEDGVHTPMIPASEIHRLRHDFNSFK
ncbi:MAG: hypothetical protein H6R18_1649 [Proteobacteria bacterium]|nr:hypothetical protein [Pseudomonadota bacterium]